MDETLADNREDDAACADVELAEIEKNEQIEARVEDSDVAVDHTDNDSGVVDRGYRENMHHRFFNAK